MITAPQIDVSVVIPCLNEEKSIGQCVKIIQSVFEKEAIPGEVIVVDNGSTDRSLETAEQNGARVIREPRKGYGAAYRRGLRETQGTYIIMGDGDLTYDFHDIPKFLHCLKNNSDFVVGSRFKGFIHKGSMKWAHRYLGNPFLSGTCRLMFKTRLSDIQCGMRALTSHAYRKMELRSNGMEFATEMIVSAVKKNLRISEVPIHYYPRIGTSKLCPVKDGWRHLALMFQILAQNDLGHES